MGGYKDFFKELTGNNPYNYQDIVGKKLLSGKNIILSIPTGAGKTWASIMPFLYAKQNEILGFPQKMIYSLPLRTLANSIYSDVAIVLEKKDEFKGLASIHTGEYKNDEHFESDVIFSTIDQTLSSFLCFPLSLSKRQANINAGALIGSYLVFDEFHLLDPELSMATTLGVLRTLKNLCRFCIMTATLSESYMNELKTAVNAEIVKIDDFPEDVAVINSLKIPKGKSIKKTIEVSKTKINAEVILKQHKQKTIVICNRVEKAQQLYSEILATEMKNFPNLSSLDRSNIICLHSRFFDDDRKEKEQRLKKLFGKNNFESAILISTQVIEAGMDISCDTMHVEISPINSFLQRAGRCARWEDQFGEIYVYDVLEIEEREQLKEVADTPEEQKQIKAINNKYLPYNKDLCEATLERLKRTTFIDKDISQQMVDEILSQKELKDYCLINQKDFNRSKIQQSWESCEKNMYSQTIRDIQSIEVAILDYGSEKNRNFHPYQYQTIGLYKWTFIKWAKEILAKEDLDNDIIFKAVDLKDSNIIDSSSLDNDGYKLIPLKSINEIKKCYDIVFVDRTVFKYTQGAGLEIGCGIICSPKKQQEQEEKEITEYKKDTFYQHNKAIINCYEQEFKPKLIFAFNQLNSYWGETDWDKLVKIMICLHDYGKLNAAWQKPMKELQKLKSEKDRRFVYNSSEVLAHSDYNELTDKEIERISNTKNKPPHAGIGARALVENVKNIIECTDYEELGNCMSTAILKHHSVETETYPDFEIYQTDYLQMDLCLKRLGVNAILKQKDRRGRLIDSLPTNKEEWIIYLFFVRILRLSDQKATMNYKKYLKQ